MLTAPGAVFLLFISGAHIVAALIIGCWIGYYLDTNNKEHDKKDKKIKDLLNEITELENGNKEEMENMQMEYEESNYFNIPDKGM